MWDCTACAACCREAFDTVPVEDDDLRTLEHQAHRVVVAADGWRALARVPVREGDPSCGTRCASLEGGGDGPWRCVMYEDRPAACSELEVGSDACRFARSRLGYSSDV